MSDAIEPSCELEQPLPAQLDVTPVHLGEKELQFMAQDVKLVPLDPATMEMPVTKSIDVVLEPIDIPASAADSITIDDAPEAAETKKRKAVEEPDAEPVAKKRTLGSILLEQDAANAIVLIERINEKLEDLKVVIPKQTLEIKDGKRTRSMKWHTYIASLFLAHISCEDDQPVGLKMLEAWAKEQDLTVEIDYGDSGSTLCESEGVIFTYGPA